MGGVTITFSGGETGTELFSGGEVTPFCGSVDAGVPGDVTAVGSSVGGLTTVGGMLTVSDVVKELSMFVSE